MKGKNFTIDSTNIKGKKNIVINSMLINLTKSMKWTNSLKNTLYQSDSRLSSAMDNIHHEDKILLFSKGKLDESE